jgi:respiratory burst oxidase
VQAEVGEARVGVFFCGNPTAKHALAKLCAQANETGSTKFIFHAEHF